MSDEKNPPEEPKASRESVSPIAGGHSERKAPKSWFSELAPAGESKIDRMMRLAAHNAASTSHGWLEHKHHTGGSIELSQADYEKALVGANSGKGKAGLHGPAVSPHNGKGL